MVNDTELLRRYAFERSEAAFCELVHRHINLVYGAALREMGGHMALAEDLSQEVYLELARNAPRLCRHPALAGWLYTCVRRMAANLRRAEFRREQREQQAHAVNELLQPEAGDSHWLEIKPVLDDAMHKLSEKDRAAVVLRFFEQRTIQEVGLALGLDKSAAHMRIDRALERLRILLSKRGVTATTSAVAAALTIGATMSAPEGLAASVTAGALTSAAAGSSTALTIKIITMAKLKIGIASALIVAGVATPLALQYQAQARLRQENQALKEQLAGQSALMEENRRLSKRVEQLQGQPLADKDQLELLRLRSEVTQLRKQNQDQLTALAAKPVSTKAPKNARSTEADARTLQMQSELKRAMDSHRAAHEAQAAGNSGGPVQNGAITVVSDETGNKHLMQFNDGQWQEIDPGDNFALTPEGAVSFRAPGASKLAGSDQTHYSIATNSSPAEAQ